MANLGRVQRVLEVIPVTDAAADEAEFNALREEVANGSVQAEEQRETVNA